MDLCRQVKCLFSSGLVCKPAGLVCSCRWGARCSQTLSLGWLSLRMGPSHSGLKLRRGQAKPLSHVLNQYFLW